MTITEVLCAAARYVEEHKATLVWSGTEVPSEAEKARIAAEVSALNHELDSLAAASETARIHPREYEVVKGELQRRGFFLTPEIVRAIADASQAEKVASAPPPRRSGVSRPGASRP